MAQPPSEPNGAPLWNDLFRHHWHVRSGRPVNEYGERPVWTMAAFVLEMQKFGIAITETTVGNWRDGRNVPAIDRKPAILAVFRLTGENASALSAALDVANGKQGTSYPVEKEERWQLLDRHSTAELAEIHFHDLEGMNRPDQWKLFATPVFGVLEQDDAEIGLSQANMTIETQYTLAQGSMLGSAGRTHTYMQYVAGSFRISGPTGNQACLFGSPVADQYLAILDPGLPGADSVTLALVAGPRSFRVTLPVEPEGDASTIAIREKKQRILNQLLLSAAKDTQGRAILAKATRKKITPD